MAANTLIKELTCYADEAEAEAPVPIECVTKPEFAAWHEAQDARVQRLVELSRFKGRTEDLCLLPDADGTLVRVLVGLGDDGEPWSLGGLPTRLPAGHYRLEATHDERWRRLAGLAWGLGAYRFDRYRGHSHRPDEAPRLVLDGALGDSGLREEVQAVHVTRDLINTPAADMMPEDLASVVTTLAEEHGGACVCVGGAELAAQYPLIYAVGRASIHAPQLIDLRWGPVEAPRLTLVGKGVCFDSGGLDIKSASTMRLMKKDMGGAAHVIGLAFAIMARKLPVRLRLLIPAVENAVAGNAMRPGDVLRARNGTTVEIENTDAEGRLVLADALTEALADGPELLIDFATLTGAARVAVGTEIAAFFANRDATAEQLAGCGTSTADPVWRLPLHPGYRSELDSAVADLMNAASSGFGGAITAALFLESFLGKEPVPDWIHFDIMAWNRRARPGRPKGGEAMGLRAALALVEQRLVATQ